MHCTCECQRYIDLWKVGKNPRVECPGLFCGYCVAGWWIEPVEED